MQHMPPDRRGKVQPAAFGALRRAPCCGGRLSNVDAFSVAPDGAVCLFCPEFLLQNDEYYKKMPEAHEDELDMLDLAFGLTET